MNSIPFIRLLYLYLLAMVFNGVLVVLVASRYEYEVHFNGSMRVFSATATEQK